MRQLYVPLLCVIVAWVFTQPMGHARDYYLNSSGNDSNPGTLEAPWKSFARVNKVDLAPGSRVLLSGGDSFQGTLLLDSADSGSKQQSTVIGSYGQGRATINAGDNNGIVADKCDYLVIQDLVIEGSGRKEGNHGSGLILLGGSQLEAHNLEVNGFRICGVQVQGVQRCRIMRVHAHDNGYAGIESGVGATSEDLYIGYCIAENNPGDPHNKENHSGNGIVISSARNVLVEYCVARNNGWDMPRGGNGPVGIWTWRADRVVIQHCISHDNKSPGKDGGGFDLDGGTTNSVLQYNLSYNNEGPGYMLCQYKTAPPLLDNIIRYNISQNDGRKTNLKSGIEIYAGNRLTSGCQIYNNTIYCKDGAAVGFGGLPVPGVVFRNNIFVSDNPPIRGDFSHARFDRNSWWTIGNAEFQLKEHPSLQDWAEATGQEHIDGKFVGLFANPRLIGPGTANCREPAKLTFMSAYRLRDDSPCLGAGLVIANRGEHDFWGNKLPPVGPVSIGAYQEATGDIPSSATKKPR